MIRARTLAIGAVVAVALTSAATHGPLRSQTGARPRTTGATWAAGARTIAVAGSGVDLLTGALVHSKDSTGTRLVQKSTEIVELKGDLVGRVLYHVTSIIDFERGTLTNTGDQVYSGTVAGSAPVMLHDDEFRFDVNLKTGAERGRVRLVHHIAGPRIRCMLDVVGTGKTPEGNPTFTYNGQCTSDRR